MYNGIGLPTPRGSGTCGYVQKNLAHVKKSRLLKPELVSQPDSNISGQRNFEILTHEKKRQIEAKCLKLRLVLEHEGRSESRIEREVDKYRQRKLRELSRISEHDHSNRVRESFGVSKDYIDGSAVTQMKRSNEMKREDEVKKEEIRLKEELEVKPDVKIKTEIKEEYKSKRDKEHRSERNRDHRSERSRDHRRRRSRSRD